MRCMMHWERQTHAFHVVRLTGTVSRLGSLQLYCTLQSCQAVCLHPQWGSCRCTRLGDAAYGALAKHCPDIEELRLYASMPSAHAIQGFSTLSKLQVIDICGAHTATGAASCPPRLLCFPVNLHCSIVTSMN